MRGPRALLVITVVVVTAVKSIWPSTSWFLNHRCLIRLLSSPPTPHRLGAYPCQRGFPAPVLFPAVDPTFLIYLLKGLGSMRFLVLTSFVPLFTPLEDEAVTALASADVAQLDDWVEDTQ